MRVQTEEWFSIEELVLVDYPDALNVLELHEVPTLQPHARDQGRNHDGTVSTVRRVLVREMVGNCSLLGRILIAQTLADWYVYGVC